jgi:3-hydroxybutyryl-CoA dehydrogenase
MTIKKVAVIGAGTMGSGIAQWFLQQNIVVNLIDLNHNFLQNAGKKIFQNFDILVSKNKISKEEANKFKNNLILTSLVEVHNDVDLVIEAIIEDLLQKRKLFSELHEILPASTIFASNTSSIPITEIGTAIPKDRQSNFLGIHFFNPATTMKLVEVINGFDTNPNVSNHLLEFFNQRGKVAVLCNDQPGFIVNRVARNFYGESLRIVENYDLEKIKEVDHILKEVGGFKMGPFELMDLIGIDINYSVTKSIYKSFFNEPRFRPHKLQKEMVLSNRLGVKTKRGFYEY